MSFKGIELNPGKGGSKVAADVVTEGAESREFQRVKIVFGPEGTITAVETGVGLPVSGTVSVSGAVDTELPAAAALADATANPTTTSVGSFVHGYNGTTWDRLRSTTANGLVVDVSRVQGSVDTELPAAAALADATANPTTPLVGAALELYNGTTWDRWRGTTTNGARVQVMAQTMTSDTATSGNIVAVAGTVAIAVSGSGTASLELRGTFTATLVFEGTEDGTNWFSIPCLERSPTPGNLATGATTTGFWFVPCGGLSQVRVRASAFTSGPVTVGWNVGSGTSVVHATDGGGSLTVDGSVAIRDGTGDSCMDNANDALRVNVVAGSAGGVSATDDAPFTVGTSSIVPVGGTYRGTRDLVDDGDTGAFAMTQRRGLLTSPETPAGDSLCDDTSDTLKVGGGVQTDASVASLAPVLMGARAADARIGAVSADGDAVPIRTNRHGEQYAHLLTPNGDSVADDTNDAIRVNVVAGAGSGGTAMTDDAAFTPGTTSITPVGGTYRSARDALDDNDAGAIALTQTRAVYTTLETPAGDTMVDETNDAVRVNVVTFSSKGIPNEPTTDTITSNGDEVLETEPDGRGVLGIDITGTWVATLQFEGTYNLSDYFAIPAYPVGGVSPVTSTTTNGQWIVQGAGMARLRVRCSAYTSGTATVKFNGSVAGWAPPSHRIIDDAGDSCMDGTNNALRVSVAVALPAGTNNIGDVDVLSLPALPAGTNNIGDVDVLTVPAPLNVTGSGTQASALRTTLATDSPLVSSLVTEDAASAANPVGLPMMLRRKDTLDPAEVSTDGDVIAGNASSAGAQYVEIVSGATKIPGDATNGLDVDVTRLPALPAGTNNIGDVDVLTLPGVTGAAAHDAAVSGNPVLLGGYAETPDDSAPGNQVSAEGDATRLAVDRDGALYTHPHPPRIWHTSNEFTTQQTDTTLKAAPGAGLSLYITDIFFAANGAVTITIEESTTTLKWRYYAAAAGDGASVKLTTPIKISANTLVSVTTSGAVTCFLMVNGYTAP